jgi:hypothetical protein
MKVSITESKLTKVIHTYLNSSFEGFDECSYDWSDFNCGMGICCDPYSVNFVLPDKENSGVMFTDDYLFKVVNGKYYDENGDYPEELRGDLPEPCYSSPNLNDKEFDTVILSEEMYERLSGLFGDVDIWSKPLLTIINDVFNANVSHYHHTFLF